MGIPKTRSGAKIPLWLKVVYTVFVAVLVPIYWINWTPLNFLYFCDVALLLTLPALWLESSLLASMMAIGITVPQLAWQVDFVSFVTFHVHFPADFTGYMFQDRQPLYLRGLSFFHFWLPILLVWMVWRLGYDRRAPMAQIGLGIVVLVVSFLLTKEINGPAGNVNKVFGLNDTTPQTSMARPLWLAVLVGAWSTVYVVSHVLFVWVIFRKRLVAYPATVPGVDEEDRIEPPASEGLRTEGEIQPERT